MMLQQKKLWWGRKWFAQGYSARVRSVCIWTLLITPSHSGWPSRDGICPLGTTSLSQQQGWDLSWVHPKWYTLLQAHFARGWLSFLMWPPLFCLTCLLNKKWEEEWDSSCGTKTWVSELVRKYLVPETLKIHNSADVSRNCRECFLGINVYLDVTFQMKHRMSSLTI